MLQRLAAHPNEKAVVNISIGGGGKTLEEYRTGMLETFRLYADNLMAIQEQDESLFDRVALVVIAGNGFDSDGDGFKEGVDLQPEIHQFIDEYPGLFLGPVVKAPAMLIVGGTEADSTEINTDLNYSSDPDHLVYAPSEQVVVSEDGSTASGTSFAAPAVSNLLAHLLAANPTLTLPQAINAFLAAYHKKGSLPTFVQMQAEIDTRPVVTVSSFQRDEGDSGSPLYPFTVSLSAPSKRIVTVAYTTVNGTASAGSDYTARSGLLTFLPGQVRKTVWVPVKGDRLVEGHERFYLRPTRATNAVIDGQGTGLIDNDDLARVTIADVSHAEGTGGTTSFVFTVTLSNPSSQVLSVDYTTYDGAAVADEDYGGVSDTLTFQPGVTRQTVTVSVVGDSDAEADEDFLVELDGLVSPLAASLADNQATGTIVNDDVLQAHVTISSVQVNVLGEMSPTLKLIQVIASGTATGPVGGYASFTTYTMDDHLSGTSWTDTSFDYSYLLECRRDSGQPPTTGWTTTSNPMWVSYSGGKPQIMNFMVTLYDQDGWVLDEETWTW